MNNDHQIEHNLDQCLSELADVLKKIGVVDFEMSENQQYHKVNTDADIDSGTLNFFCSNVTRLYVQIVTRGEVGSSGL